MDPKIKLIYERKRIWDHWSKLIARSERQPNGCLEWKGSKWGNYGSVCLGGKCDLVHRHAWRLVRGPIPNGLWVLHHCDNPPCWEPTHLFLGDRIDNIYDAIEKGRPWGRQSYEPIRQTS